MRKWSVNELDRIESDIRLASEIVREDFALYFDNPSSLLNSEMDCAWLAERIGIREQHGTHAIERCDGCPDGAAVPVIVCVNEYPDDMGAPSSLGVSYVCRYHVQSY